MIKDTHQAADFFVIRSNRLSLKPLMAWDNSDRAVLRHQLQQWFEQPQTQEAIYIASPSLLDRAQQWYGDPDSKKSKKFEQALAKYFIRMTSRPTPFGLFSGVGMGDIGEQNQLKFTGADEFSRKTRLDMYYLFSLRSQLVEQQWREKNLPLLANPTTYVLGQQLRYIESYHAQDRLHYRLSSAENDPFVQAVLTTATSGASVNDLIECLCQLDQDITSDEADGYIGQLVEARLLIPQLPLPLTGDSPDSDLNHSLSQAGFNTQAQTIAKVLADINQLDAAKVNTPADYRAVLKQLKALPFPVTESKLFQVDVYRSEHELTLDKQLCQKVLKDLSLFHSLSTQSENPLQGVVDKFNSHYAGRMMPLKAFLDDESGWSMGSDKGFATPLLKGLDLNQAGGTPPGVTIAAIDRLLMENISAMADPFEPEIRLSEKQVRKYSNGKSAALASSAAMMLQLYQNTAGELEVFYRGSYGSSAANLLGRFCHLDQQLQNKVKDLLVAEESLEPDAIFAEIVHLPEGRVGNVIARPILRQYEIPFLTDSTLDDEFQIQLDDLLIYVDAGMVKLWSKRHQKRIIPRLSSAHNYGSRSLGIYTFLCMVQNQTTSNLRFNWSNIFDSATYLPRIRFGDLIIAKRRWRIKRELLVAIEQASPAKRAGKLERLKQQHHIPQWISYTSGDNFLLLNLNNPVMLEVLLAETQGRAWVQFEEVLEAEFSSGVSLDDAPLSHEVIVPLLNKPSNTPQVNAATPKRKIVADDIVRSFSPGSEWLSMKVYMGNSSGERLLAENILPLVSQFNQQGLISHFFFLRYGDPDWHLRLRFKGDPAVLLTQVLPKLHQQLDPLHQSGLIQSLQLDTYGQEVERYGGAAAINVAEHVFHTNSLLCLQLLHLLAEIPDDYRWRSVVVGCDTIMSAFGLTLEDKLELATQLSQGFGREFGDSAALRKQMGVKYRQLEAQIKADLSAKQNEKQSDETMLGCIRLIEDNKTRLLADAKQYQTLAAAGQLDKPLINIIDAILHMFNNRMFVAYGRQQEFVVHELLRRYYEFCYHAAKRAD